MKITGLDQRMIVEQIKKKEAAEKYKEIKNELKSQKSATESKNDTVLLNEVCTTLKIILAKLESLESDVEQLKKNGSQSSIVEDKDLLLFTPDVATQPIECLF
jgi:ATP:corrinoid adenosyltransferase